MAVACTVSVGTAEGGVERIGGVAAGTKGTMAVSDGVTGGCCAWGGTGSATLGFSNAGAGAVVGATASVAGGIVGAWAGAVTTDGVPSSDLELSGAPSGPVLLSFAEGGAGAVSLGALSTGCALLSLAEGCAGAVSFGALSTGCAPSSFAEGWAGWALGSFAEACTLWLKRNSSAGSAIPRPASHDDLTRILDRLQQEHPFPIFIANLLRYAKDTKRREYAEHATFLRGLSCPLSLFGQRSPQFTPSL